MEILEEYRDLSIIEWNFRALLRDKYASLLRQQQIYWKQQGTIKWVKFGDEGTKFCHANATIKERRNLITTLKDSADQPQTNHHIKATILWEAYKDRLGSTNSPVMHFSLKDLIQRVEDLDCLTEPFSHEEIDDVIKNLPSDKSPGPDGFNTDFIKK